MFADAHLIPSWQNSDMNDPAFDADLVATTMKARKVTQTGMAKIMGLPSQSAFSNILKGKRRITAEEAAIAYRFLGLERAPTIQQVPIIGITQAGNWREAIDLPMGTLPIPPQIASDDAFALQVDGNSMNLLIEEGGFIIVDPREKELRAGKSYVIQNLDGETTVKCYMRDPARFEPVSDDDTHKGWLVSEREFSVVGRVVWKGAPL